MISKKTKYALKALHRLAREYERKTPILIADLARDERIPKKFLEQILLELKNAHILQSKMGKGGGYQLAKEPKTVTIGSVMRIFEGPLAPLPCLSQTAYRKCDECLDEKTCALKLVMKDAYQATIKILDNTTLQNMLEKSLSYSESIMYSI